MILGSLVYLCFCSLKISEVSNLLLPHLNILLILHHSNSVLADTSSVEFSHMLSSQFSDHLFCIVLACSPNRVREIMSSTSVGSNKDFKIGICCVSALSIRVGPCTLIVQLCCHCLDKYKDGFI